MGDLVILAKYPFPGEVKTRLAADIGERKAARFAKAMLDDMVGVASGVCEVTIAASRGEAHLFRQAYDCNVCATPRGSLLSKIFYSVRDRYVKGAQAVVAITADVVVNADEIRDWFSVLEGGGVLLGPTFDNLFYLIGLGRRGDVLADSVYRSIKRAGIHILMDRPGIHLAAKKRDIDRLDDLLRTEFPPDYRRTRELVNHL